MKLIRKRERRHASGILEWIGSLLLLTAIIVVMARPAWATPIRVAVIPFENVSRDTTLDWLSLGVSETLTNDLIHLKDVVLVERTQLQKVLAEQSFQLTGAVDPSKAVEVGKLLGANVLVVGAYQKQGDIVRLTARFVDVESGIAIQSAKATGKLSDIFDLQDQVVIALVRNLNLEIKEAEFRKLEQKPTNSLAAYEHLGRGALYEARNNYAGAIKEYKEAAKADPNFDLAKTRFMGAFLSLNKGNYWQYAVSGSGRATGPSLATYRAEGEENLGGTPCFTYLFQMGDQNTKIFYLKGEDGIYLAGTSTTMANAAKPVTVIYSKPYMDIPYELTVGKKWRSVAIAKTGRINLKTEYQYSILGMEKIDVPSVGIVDCYVIETTEILKKWGTVTRMVTRRWFTPGIGIVKTTDEVSSNGKEIAGHTSVLQKYQIEQ